MSQFTIVVPEYSRRFRCIGGACEQTCCTGWKVPVDRAAMAKYAAVPAGDLRRQLEASIQPTTNHDAFWGASIGMLPDGDCPFFTEQRLCRIQSELGEAYLCTTCADFPRLTHSVDDIEESALTLSCPEAARLVLLDPELHKIGRAHV